MKDNLQLIGQVILIVLGPLLAKHNITVGNNQIDDILGALSDLVGIVWKFWHWNSTPSAPATAPVATAANKAASSQAGYVRFSLILLICTVCLLASLLSAFVGCASIQPGQDPVVVNVERTQTIAAAAFDTVLAEDNADRGFWRTNAPAFHNFCEWLRVSQAVQVGNLQTNLPRALALQANLDNVKLAYKAGRATSNDVFTVALTLNSAVTQADSWLTIVTNQPAK